MGVKNKAEIIPNNLSAYHSYKPSGVEWLGDVPAHWELRRTKTLLRERSEKGRPSEALLAATQTKGVVRKEQYENRTVLALKDLHLLKFVKIGDFVISLRSFQGGIEYAREQGIISPAYTILYTADSSLRDYLALLFKSKPYLENITLHVTGIRQGQNIDYSELSRSYLPLPPLPGTSRHRPLPGPRRPAHPAVRHRQAQAHRAARGGAGGRRQPCRHPGPRPQRPSQALRRRVAWRRAGALGCTQASAIRICVGRRDPQHGGASLLGRFGSMGDSEGHETRHHRRFEREGHR